MSAANPLCATVANASREVSDHLEGDEARRRLWPHVRHLFRNRGPQVLLVNAAVLIAARLWVGAFAWSQLGIVAAVWAWWPLQEWVLHRYVLHQKPFTIFGRRFDTAYGRYHRAHHKQPWRLDKTLVPTWLLVVLVPMQAVWWLPFSSRAAALTAAAAFAFAAVVYEWCHYLAHASYRPRTRYVRKLVQNHRMHHFRSEVHWYSFTVPWVDTWLGTDPPPGSIKPSPTVRTLGVDDGA